MPNKNSKFENQMYTHYKKKGWTILNSGWPDFLLVKGDSIKAVEVKAKNDYVKDNQAKVLTVLSKLMPVFTVHPGPGYGGESDEFHALIYPRPLWDGAYCPIKTDEYNGLGVS
jgi:hypothetical protein